ncbi:MAG TPA: TetR/AcrR family transcriptional regulator [Acidimicrobiales bacterium]
MGETIVTAGGAGVADPGDAAEQQDGRLSRAARTRAAVVDALLNLHEQGNLRPTARDIATEAGVSLRSLYVHFDDLEALFVAASQRQGERLAAVMPPLVTEGTLDQRLDAFLARRACILDFGAGVRKAALLQAPFSPAIQQALSSGRKALRADAVCAFGPELEAAGGKAGKARLLRAIDIATGPATWESLREHQNLSTDEAVAQLRAMVLAFVHAWVPSAAAPATTTSGASRRG